MLIVEQNRAFPNFHIADLDAVRKARFCVHDIPLCPKDSQIGIRQFVEVAELVWINS